VTSELAPTATPSPSVTPGSTTAFAPTIAWLPMCTNDRIGVRYGAGTAGLVRQAPE
jgi:hypothetical protein